MGYRETYFNNKISIFGRYRCARCKRWFKKSEIDVDHRIAKRLGGTDDLWNLQAMCKHCNRSKGKNSTQGDVVKTVAVGTISGLIHGGAGGVFTNIARLVKSVVIQKIKDVLGIKYKR